MRPMFSDSTMAESGKMNGSSAKKIRAELRGNLPVAREILNIRSALKRAHDESGIRSLLLTGLYEQSGTTTVATVLALALCWDQVTRVLLVDANFLNPQLQNIFKIKIDSSSSLIQETQIPTLKCIPFGMLMRVGNRSLEDYVRVLKELENDFDFMILDTAPVLSSPETLMLSSYFSRVAIVVEAERTMSRTFEKVIADFQQAKADILGVVLNRKKTYLPALLSTFIQ